MGTKQIFFRVIPSIQTSQSQSKEANSHTGENLERKNKSNGNSRMQHEENGIEEEEKESNSSVNLVNRRLHNGHTQISSFTSSSGSLFPSLCSNVEPIHGKKIKKILVGENCGN